MEWTCMAATGTGSLVLTEAAVIRIRMNSEVYRAILSAHIQPNATKLIGRCFRVQMGNDLKHIVTAKTFKGKKLNFLQHTLQASHLIST